MFFLSLPRKLDIKTAMEHSNSMAVSLTEPSALFRSASFLIEAKLWNELFFQKWLSKGNIQWVCGQSENIPVLCDSIKKIEAANQMGSRVALCFLGSIFDLFRTGADNSRNILDRRVFLSAVKGSLFLCFGLSSGFHVIENFIRPIWGAVVFGLDS